MPEQVLRGHRPRPRTIFRSLAVRAAGTAMAGAAVIAAPAAAQAAAGPVVVPCSASALVTAISQANSAGTATLVLARGCHYVLTSAAVVSSGLPPVTGSVTLLGGRGTQISRGPMAPPFRILQVAPGGALTLVGITVANGELAGASGFGGGILDQGTLVLRNARLTGNTNGGTGGGLYVDHGAQATISGSELDGNTGGTGGAMYSDGALTISSSALLGNTAVGSGGGVFADLGGKSRISSTVVARNIAGQGGGITALSAMVLSGDRVVLNKATVKGGGIISPVPGAVTLRSTLVASNTPDNCNPQGTIAGCRA
jgi:hypothetical protein